VWDPQYLPVSDDCSGTNNKTDRFRGTIGSKLLVCVKNIQHCIFLAFSAPENVTLHSFHCECGSDRFGEIKACRKWIRFSTLVNHATKRKRISGRRSQHSDVFSKAEPYKNFTFYFRKKEICKLEKRRRTSRSLNRGWLSDKTQSVKEVRPIYHLTLLLSMSLPRGSASILAVFLRREHRWGCKYILS
jgi:hypothetical protein